jgi:hypothetical protein
MTQIESNKKDFLAAFHRGLRGPVGKIVASRGTRKQKAREVNSLAWSIKTELSQVVGTLPKNERPNYALVLQYCFSVASLEYRHKVWPYEYMAFSRRVGELWEAFCRAAWDYPSKPSVARIPVPDFGSVREALFARIKANIGTHGKREEIIEDVKTLFEIIGDINMREDEVFTVDQTPHVIDFKSGFGSNERATCCVFKPWGRHTESGTIRPDYCFWCVRKKTITICEYCVGWVFGKSTRGRRHTKKFRNSPVRTWREFGIR